MNNESMSLEELAGLYRKLQETAEAMEVKYKDEIARLQEKLEILSDREEEFRGAFFGAKVGQAQADPVTERYLRVNQAFCEFVGYTEAELLQKTIPEITYKEDVEFHRDIHRRLSVGEKDSIGVEKRYIHKSGKIVWGYISITMLFYPDGTPRLSTAVIQDITGRKAMEESLRQSEEKFYKAFHSSPDVIVIASLSDGKVVEVNDRMRELSGYSAEDNIGRTTDNLLLWENPADRQRYVELIDRDGKVTDMEVNFRTKSGEVRNTLLSGEVIALRDGDYILSVIRDITAIRKTEADLRESEMRYRLLMENSLDAVILSSPTKEEIILSANKAACDMFGMTEEELYKCERKDLIDPSDLRLQGLLRERDEKGRVTGEITLFRKGRIPFPAEVSTSLYKDANGKLFSSLIIRDISGRKKAEQELRESEIRFETLFRKAILPIVLAIAPDYRIIDVNEAWIRLLGYSREESIGKTSLELGISREKDKVDKIVDQINEFGELIDEERVFYTKSGETVVVLMNISTITFSGQQYAFATMQDITARKRAEKEIKQSLEQLERLNSAMNEIREQERAMISRELHDELGQSLTALKIDLNWIRKNTASVTGLDKRFDEMTGLLDSTIRNVQHISSELRPSLLDDLGLAAAIEWYCGECKDRTGIRFDLQLEDVQADTASKNTALFRILQESVTNVIRHAEASNVYIRLTGNKEEICLRVEDDGVGIPPEKLNSWESIGLTGMSERARQFKGHFRIESKPGEGTAVEVTIPGTG